MLDPVRDPRIGQPFPQICAPIDGPRISWEHPQSYRVRSLAAAKGRERLEFFLLFEIFKTLAGLVKSRAFVVNYAF